MMKKSIMLLMFMAICLFAGLAITNAASGKINVVQECEDAVPASDGKTKTQKCKFVVTFDIGFSGKNQATTWEFKYKNPTDYSDFKITNAFGDIGSVDESKMTKTKKSGGTFVYNYSDVTIEKGKKYTLFEFEYTEDASLAECGATFATKGTSTTGDDDRGADDNPNTGVSIPVAVIGVGSLAGLAIYSVSSRKTKLRRI